MAVAGWILDKSAAARAADRVIGVQIAELAGQLYICPISELEQLYSARSARDYEQLQAELHASFDIVAAPPDVLERALLLQRNLAHHHGMWHRTPIPDLLIAETAVHHGLGVVHVDGDYARIAEVRPLTVRGSARAHLMRTEITSTEPGYLTTDGGRTLATGSGRRRGRTRW